MIIINKYYLMVLIQIEAKFKNLFKEFLTLKKHLYKINNISKEDEIFLKKYF